MQFSFSYDEAMQYIHGVSWLGSRLGLDRTKTLLKMMGNPEKTLKFVHIAGTNGKGSVSAMLSSILCQAGFVTGLYTSPFILKFNERISVNCEPIDDDALADITSFVAGFAETMDDKPTEFELITAIGFEYFKRRACDLVVLEVGLGGELDSTNVIPAPEVAVITALGLDHTEQLGGTIQSIASAKAGIIKSGTTVAFYGGEKAEYDVIKAKCDNLGVKLTTPNYDSFSLITADLNGFYFGFGKYKRLFLPLCGHYQQKNVSLVLATAKLLQQRGWQIDEAAIRNGLAKIQWRARFEKLLDCPTVIFDGGHNPQGVKGALDSLDMLFPGKQAVFVTGVMADKDVKGVLQLIKPYVKMMYAVSPDNPRAMSAKKLSELAAEIGIDATAATSVGEGVKLAIKQAGRDGLVLVIGSLYMYSTVHDTIQEMIETDSQKKLAK